MKKNDADDELDLNIGGVPLGAFMKAVLQGSKTSFIISIAALAVSIGSLAVAIVSLTR